ncbi:hypothetical protein [Caulobacter endophyticus]|uniref:hypothetical protein n=1 Tax=Caulobacter endophyticus TaxID=2172652 RepID=UPI002410A695|nr:hypothetical protein [Caulobacter endophyticus]MDG2530538.1 hypothetical protein [Caulobacter endophyticus]
MLYKKYNQSFTNRRALDRNALSKSCAGAELEEPSGQWGQHPSPAPINQGPMLLSWITIAEVGLDAYESIGGDAHLRLQPNPGFLKEISIGDTRAYRPWAVIPDLSVWQAVVRDINQAFGGQASGRTSTLTLTDPGQINARRYTFSIRLYRPNILAIEVRLLDSIDCDLAEAFAVRELAVHRAASRVVDLLIGIVKSGNLHDIELRNSRIERPIIYFPVDIDPAAFEDWKEENKRLIAGLATNNKKWKSQDPDFADKIFDANREIDIKHSSHALSIVNKQGIVTAFTSQEETVRIDMMRDHEKRIVFLEFALALHKFSTKFPRIRESNENLADFLYYLAKPMLQENAIIPKSVNGTHIWSVISKDLALPDSIGKISTHTASIIESKFQYFSTLSEEDFDHMDFLDHVQDSIRRHGKWPLERLYERRPFLFWAITTLIAIGHLVVNVASKIHPLPR